MKLIQKKKKHNKLIVYLIGNKIDKLKRGISKEEAEEKAQFYGIKYFEMSCKLNLNVSETSARMINECFLKLEENKNDEEQELIKNGSFTLKKLKKNKEHKNKGCCLGTREES